MARKSVTGWASGLLLAAALFFGAGAALAAPAPLGAGPACDEQKCDYYCVTTGGANYGFCFNGTCVCRSGP